jgi:hypothetical protein
MADRPLMPVNRLHLAEMTGPQGIWQHAIGALPNRAYGVCSDDVARALLVDLAHARVIGWDAVAPDARRSLRFLDEAWDPALRRFRNYRGEDGGWARTEPSEDCQGRALLAIGTAVGAGPHGADAAGLGRSHDLLAAALPSARDLRALRATSSAILGCAAALDGLHGDDPLHHATRAMLALLANRLGAAFDAADDQAWPWPEDVLTYENALLPHALIVGGAVLGADAPVRRGLGVLGWLLGVQTSEDGWFSPIGNDGWWSRGGTRSRFDQQPIEAAATILACHAAVRQAGGAHYARAAERAFGWFFGDNDGGTAVALPDTGGCRDGLLADGVNGNQGAESTLAWLLSVEAIRDVRGRIPAPPRLAARSRVLAAPSARR